MIITRKARNDPMTRKPQVVTQLCRIFAGAADEYYFVDYSYTVWCAFLPTARWSKAVNPPSEGMPDRAGDGEQRRKLRWVVAPRFTTLYPIVRFGGNGG